MSLATSSGKQKKPVKLVIYGTEGIGKTTAASLAPSPLLLDIEKGSHHLSIDRNDEISSIAMLMKVIADFATGNHKYKTLIIDTIDWVERIVVNEVCAENSWPSIEHPGWGKGWKPVQDKLGKLLDFISDNVKTNVIIIAHAHIIHFTLPEEEGEFDRYELKMNKKNAGLLKEWSDAVLFFNYKTMMVKGENDKKTKAQGGRRYAYTTHTPAFDAKNRLNLASEFSLDEFEDQMKKVWYSGSENNKVVKEDVKKNFKERLEEDERAAGITTNPSDPAVIPENNSTTKTNFHPALYSLMDAHDVKENEIQWAQSVANKGNGYYPIDMPVDSYPEEFVQSVLVARWEGVFKKIQRGRTEGAITGEIDND